MLLLSFPCLSRLSSHCTNVQMFLMELPHHAGHCGFRSRLSGGGDSCYVTDHIVIGSLFINFLVLNQLQAVSVLHITFIALAWPCLWLFLVLECSAGFCSCTHS